ncbi:hypothetical protein [Aphanizomenon sp. UHCC 0183]|uniref:hypothetical protein n=1 Tax=Aphanizomenon sp. UHCC 0183 TaxID=2590028 RepID=UPI0015807FC7|nr:hypothetical protein [Aphanizomenon sp. UHCC 0183]
MSKVVDLGESPEEIIKRLRDEGTFMTTTKFPEYHCMIIPPPNSQRAIHLLKLQSS